MDPDVWTFLNYPLLNKRISAGGNNRRDEDDDMSSERPSHLTRNPYVANALKVIKFIVAYEGANEDNVSKPYHPKMAHQLFGQDEIIHGYRNLQITISFLPNRFDAFLDMSYSHTYHNSIRGFQRDDIIKKLTDWFPLLTILSRNQEVIDNDLHRIYGEIIYSCEFRDGNKTPCNIFVTKCSSKDNFFMSFHKRFQAQIVFFIDAASIIDYSDSNWEYFYLYKEIVNGNHVDAILPVGFCTAYNFVESGKSRISQFFILPNFQRKSLGSRFLAVLYKHFTQNHPCRYLTVESPCDEFTKMREKLELRLLKDNPQFTRELILGGYSTAFEDAAERLAKITKKQTKRLYYILRFFYTRGNSEQRQQFVDYMTHEIAANYREKLRRLSNRSGERYLRYKKIAEGDPSTNTDAHMLYLKFLKSIATSVSFLRSLELNQ